MADMKVGFYGHVRQYHSLKPEIDKAISDVLESGAYVMGPQAKVLRCGPAVGYGRSPSVRMV